MDSLNIVAALIAAAQGAMVTIADVAWRLGATIAVISLLFGLAVRIAGGASGVAAAVISWIVHTGLVLGAISLWPILMAESFETADALAEMIGGAGIGAIDVIQRGYDVFARIVNHGVQGSIWNPVNGIMYLAIVGMGGVLLAVHVVLSLIVAVSILQFWIGGAVMPIIIPFALIAGLQGIGFQAFAYVISCVVRLIVVAVIVALGGQVFLDIAIPDSGSTLTLLDLAAAMIATVVVTFLAWRASTWASVIARAAPGSTGITGMVGLAVTAGLGAMATGGAAAGGASAGSAAAGGMQGGQASGGQASGGGGRSGGQAASVGSQSRA